MMKRYLVTGGVGFIGVNYVKWKLNKCKIDNEECKIIILDKLTYAGDLASIKEELSVDNHQFVINGEKKSDLHLNYGDRVAGGQVDFYLGDICDKEIVEKTFQGNDIDYVVNFAAESHVDRSIENPRIFLESNILGTQTLMDVAKAHWTNGKDDKGYPTYREGKKFLQVSTDEVYGALTTDFKDGRKLKVQSEELKVVLKMRKVMPKTFGTELFTEETPLDPRSPYAVSKTSADMLVRAYAETYRFPVNVTRCSNNYGPYHFPEKLIPLIIKNILEGKKLPVYGDGKQVRDWLYVDDHCKGIDMVINKGRLSEAYNIGGFNEEQNINIVKLTIDTIARIMREEPKYQGVLKTDLSNINYDLIVHVQDRLGHDARYAIDPIKTVRELGFYPETPFPEGIEKTIKWYLENQKWVEEVVSGEYQKYYDEMYGNR